MGLELLGLLEEHPGSSALDPLGEVFLESSSFFPVVSVYFHDTN